MAETKLADVIVPEIFNQYVINESVTKSAFFASGIAAVLPEVGANFPAGGKTVNMPYWNDLSGDSVIIDDTTNLTISNITTGQDEAVVVHRGKVFGATDLSAELAGDDPMRVIGDRFAAYWQREMQTALINTLAGAMATTVSGYSMAANTHNISALSGAAGVFDADSFLDACQKLGDAQDSLAGCAVHSATYNLMLKSDLIDFIKPSDASDAVPTYIGKRVIVDDSMPVSGANYTSYIFGPGAIGYAEGNVKNGSEVGREPLQSGGTDYIVNRRRFVMHPRGIRWAGNVSPSPTNAQLATTTNWNRVYDQKKIRIVRFVHKIA
jgi:hypothetical protein